MKMSNSNMNNISCNVELIILSHTLSTFASQTQNISYLM